MKPQSIIAAAGVALGWMTVERVTGAAQIFAYVGTGAWAFAQVYFLIRRERCKAAPNCPNRQT